MTHEPAVDVRQHRVLEKELEDHAGDAHDEKSEADCGRDIFAMLVHKNVWEILWQSNLSG